MNWCALRTKKVPPRVRGLKLSAPLGQFVPRERGYWWLIGWATLLPAGYSPRARVKLLDCGYVPPIVPPGGQKAVAVQEYARRAKDLTLEHKAAKARIWFERRCGKLLQDMELDKGGDSRRYNGATSVDRPQTLKDMGLSKYQSSRFQQLFDVPENEFIDELAKLDRTSKTTISSSRILNERKRKAKEKAEASAIQKSQTARVMLAECLSILDSNSGLGTTGTIGSVKDGVMGLKLLHILTLTIKRFEIVLPWRAVMNCPDIGTI